MTAITKTKSIPATRALHIYEGTLDPTEIPNTTDAMAEIDLTVTGVLSTDMVVSFYATDQVTFGIGNARVKAANTVAVMFVNTDTDTEVNPAGTLNYRLIVCPAI